MDELRFVDNHIIIIGKVLLLFTDTYIHTSIFFCL